jgi:hypothetical protein
MIAYRLQAERLGDLDRDTQRFLGQVAAGTRNGDELPAKRDHLTRHGLQPGTILVREWDGKSQRVMVLDQGFAWNGTTYRSLTDLLKQSYLSLERDSPPINVARSVWLRRSAFKKGSTACSVNPPSHRRWQEHHPCG